MSRSHQQSATISPSLPVEMLRKLARQTKNGSVGLPWAAGIKLGLNFFSQCGRAGVLVCVCSRLGLVSKESLR